MMITTTTICDAMALEMTIALAQEIGRRLKHAGWTRYRVVRPSGGQVWAYRSTVRGAQSTVNAAVNDLLEQRTIEYYQRKAGIQPHDFKGEPIEHVAAAIADAAANAGVIDWGDEKCIVFPMTLWRAIIDSIPGV